MQNNDAQVYVKSFIMNQHNIFEKIKSQIIDDAINKKNLFFNTANDLVSVDIYLVTDEVGSDPADNIKVLKRDNSVTIQLPKVLLFHKLIDPNNQMERVMMSNNGRLILCGKVII